MPNTVPYEVISAPGTAYLAATGTAFPAINAAPSGSFTKLGTNGDLNYDGATGIVVSHPQSINKWRSLGDLGSRKIFPTEEDLMIKLKVVDLTLEQLKYALNNNTVTDTAAGSGTAGHRKVGLSRSFTVSTFALLLRFNTSAYGATATWNTQYEIPIVAMMGSPELMYKQGEPVGYELEFHALVDSAAASAAERFGVLRMMDADPI